MKKYGARAKRIIADGGSACRAAPEHVDNAPHPNRRDAGGRTLVMPYKCFLARFITPRAPPRQRLHEESSRARLI